MAVSQNNECHRSTSLSMGINFSNSNIQILWYLNIKWWMQQKWNCIKNSASKKELISASWSHKERSPGVLYWTHSDVWMGGLDNFKKYLEATEIWFLQMDFNEIKRNIVTRSWHNINRTCKFQSSFFGHVMRREKLEHLATTGMIKGKTAWKDVGWTNKVAQSRMSDRCTEKDEGQRCMEGHDCLR